MSLTFDSNPNYARDQALTTSTSSFITSLIVNTAVAGGELVAFFLLRRWIKAVYEPRTYIPPKDLQAPVLGNHLWWPIWRIIAADSKQVLEKNGVDPYVFIRFLHMMAKALIPIWLLSWAVLLPLNSVGTGVEGKSGLDMLTAGNIGGGQQRRFWAHLVLDYLFIFWILYLMWIELQNWLVIRQQFLVNPTHSKLPQANTVLIQGIPQAYLDEEKLSQLFAHLPGGVKRIWLNRNLKEMPELYDRREKATNQLEKAQVNLIKFARTYRVNREHKVESLEKKGKPLPDVLAKPINADMLAPYRPTNDSSDTAVTTAEAAEDMENGEGHASFLKPEDLGKADQLVPRNKRPSHRINAPLGLGFLGLGQKVDTIDWARNEIATCTAALQQGREQLQKDVDSIGTDDDVYPPLNSAFIRFNQQIAAHMARQILIHHKPYSMSDAYIEQSPQNVIWSNLNLSAYDKNIRRAGSVAATFGLLLAWVFPVAFIGALSNVTSLITQYPWMAWLGGDSAGKKVLQGVISGLLPPILLAVINLLLPVVLRIFARLQGIPSQTAVELDLMTRYFIFLVVHTFFVITLTSGLLAAVTSLVNDPASIAVVLSQQMPTASTFFITLILTQFTGTIGTLLQPITLAFYYIKVILGGGSPRSIYRSRYTLQTTGWGQQFPAVTVYAVIMLAYMVISPVILGFGACFFVLSAIVYKYLFIWVYDQPPEQDTGGLFFPKAITHVFVGMYIQEVALCAFFFLLRDDNLNASAIAQGALMVVLIVITAAVHYTIHTSYGPLINALPLSLSHLSYGMPKEEGHDNSQAGDDVGENNGDGSGTRTRSGTVTGTPRDYTKPNDASLNLVGFSVALPQPVAGVKREAQSALRKIDRGLGGQRLTFDTDVSMVVRPTETLATSTAPGPPQVAQDQDVEDIEMNAVNRENGDGNIDGYTKESRQSHDHKRNSTSATAEEDSNPFFAVPGGPGIQLRNPGREGDKNAFFHPATKEPQRVIWLPKDDLGLCVAEVEKNRQCGVDSSWRSAKLTSEGKVQISGRPPGLIE